MEHLQPNQSFNTCRHIHFFHDLRKDVNINASFVCQPPKLISLLQFIDVVEAVQQAILYPFIIVANTVNMVKCIGVEQIHAICYIIFDSGVPLCWNTDMIHVYKVLEEVKFETEW